MAVGYQAVRCVVRGDADLDPVSNHDLDPMLFHPSGKHCPYDHIIVAFDFHRAAAKDLGDCAVKLD
jgi:hypothetical protein